jgi:hypothetical protein
VSLDTKTGTVKSQKKITSLVDSMEFDTVSQKIYATFYQYPNPNKLVLIDPITGNFSTVVALPDGWLQASYVGTGKYTALSRNSDSFVALGYTGRETHQKFFWLHIDLKTKQIIQTPTNDSRDAYVANLIFDKVTDLLYGTLHLRDATLVVQLNPKNGKFIKSIATISDVGIWTGFIVDSVFYLATHEYSRQRTPEYFTAVDLKTGSVTTSSTLGYAPICIRT